MREGGDFGEAAEGEGEGFGIGGKGLARRGVEGEIEEDLVHDEREVVFEAKGVEARELFGLNIGASGIVGMNEKDGAGARRNGALERLKIDEPTVGVFERVSDQLDILKAGEKFEKWIAGFGQEQFVIGIAQQTEDVRVGFAGAGGEKERFRIDGGLVVVQIVAGDFAAGGEGAFGLRIIL